MPRTTKYQRRPVGKTVKRSGLVKVGGEWLPPREGQFLVEYLRHFNGSKAARAVGVLPGTAPQTSSELLRKPKVRDALTGALEERRRRVDVDADRVARYWHDVATADPRELCQHVYVPCRHCWGEDHQYQFTRGELQQAVRDHDMGIRRVGDRFVQLTPEQRKRPVDILGGDGYTHNKYPMRGPDWAERVARTYDAMGAPLPEGLGANSDHSCPECHGDGTAMVVFADTRHLSPEAARLFSGVRVTASGGIEVKMLDRLAAMDKFQELVGLVRPRRAKLAFNLEELSDTDLDALLDEARTRGLLSDEEVTRGKLVDATPPLATVEKDVK